MLGLAEDRRNLDSADNFTPLLFLVFRGRKSLPES